MIIAHAAITGNSNPIISSKNARMVSAKLPNINIATITTNQNKQPCFLSFIKSLLSVYSTIIERNFLANFKGNH